MNCITIKGEKEYKVIENKGCLCDVGIYISREIKGRNALIVTDEIVSSLYAEKIAKSLEKNGFCVYTHVLRGGEQNKTLFEAEKIYKSLCEKAFSRDDVIVATGGGITGDMAGFAASTYMRGMKFVNIPTTLIAQTDSAIGGKTGVNYNGYKNMIGAFYEPDLVYIDTDVLDTLPKREYNCGMAEVIKYAAIQDGDMAKSLMKEKTDMPRIVMRCVDMKRSVTEKDTHDMGIRHILNFGHTIGHAVEKATENSISHGEGVAMGMCAMGKLGEKLGITQKGTAKMLNALCEKFSLPTVIPCCDYEKHICLDKKHSGENIKLVFLEKFGKACIKEMKTEDFVRYLHE